MTIPLFSLGREQVWQAIPKYFDTLPAHLFRQYLLLMHNLGLQASATGQFPDLMSRSYDYPLLDQSFWLLNDLNAGSPQEREAFGADLLTSTLLHFLASRIEQDMSDENTFITAEYKTLQETFYRDSFKIWQRLFSPNSPFWSHHPAEPHILNKWELGQLSLTAAAIWAGYESHLPRLLAMTDHLIPVFQAVENFTTMQGDVKDGRRTPVLQRALEAVGAAERTTFTYEFVMGALILTGTMKKIIAECQAQVDAAHVIAQELNLPSFQLHCKKTKSMLEQVQELFSLRENSQQGDEFKTFFLPAPDLLPFVLVKAQDFLLAEPTFFEAWEVQRYSYPKAANVTGQIFPSALILEALGRHGYDISKSVDEIFEICAYNGFGYYNQPGWVPPDADTIAFIIRVSSYSSKPEETKKQLQTPLRWIRENQKPSGQIPVWFMRNDFPVSINPLSVMYGGECSTVEANLMLGLIGHDWQIYQDVIESCAHTWCDRWLDVGLGGTGHYTPLFSLWTSLELVHKISALSKDDALLQKLDVVTSDLIERLSRESRRTDLTPQDASFLILACLCASDSRLPFDMNWLTILYKNQKWDGSWVGEPLYIVPSGRGLTTNWLASRTITTAFCFHALKTYQKRL